MNTKPSIKGAASKNVVFAGSTLLASTILFSTAFAQTASDYLAFDDMRLKDVSSVRTNVHTDSPTLVSISVTGTVGSVDDVPPYSTVAVDDTIVLVFEVDTSVEDPSHVGYCREAALKTLNQGGVFEFGVSGIPAITVAIPDADPSAKTTVPAFVYNDQSEGWACDTLKSATGITKIF